MLDVGGLFSGVGGWELGLERAGMRTLWHCEADPFARSVLERHWPDVPVYPDVCDLRGADVEPVDVVCGGFPCHDISDAGRKAGIAGARSRLWGEMFRVVRELRPRYVLVENSGSLTGRGLDVVLGDLASIGFDAEWEVLTACAFGAPHTRRRMFVVAYPQGERGQQRRRLELAEGCDPPRDLHHWQEEPGVDRVADGLPHQMDRNRALGNALVPQVAELIGRRIVEWEEGRMTASKPFQPQQEDA